MNDKEKIKNLEVINKNYGQIIEFLEPELINFRKIEEAKELADEKEIYVSKIIISEILFKYLERDDNFLNELYFKVIDKEKQIYIICDMEVIITNDIIGWYIE